MPITLSSPFDKFALPNRIVMAPMSRFSTCGDGLPTSELEEYYVKRALNGAGVIIVEGAAIDSKASLSYVGGLQFNNENHAERWKKIIKRIHQHGGRVWLQLYHAGRLTTSEVSGSVPLAPSAIKPIPNESHLCIKENGRFVHFQTKTAFPTPKEMTIDEIKSVQRSFARSCRLAIQAGFDGIELHAAHGYLLHQFNYKGTNQRRDEYGLEDGKYRFLQETVKECRKFVPLGKILSLRMSLHMVDFVFLRYSKEDIDFQKIVEQVDDKIDVYHCSEIKAGHVLFGSKVSLIDEVGSATSKPIIACGGIKWIKDAEELLNDRGVSLIAFGRNFIFNPDFAQIIKSGSIGELKEFQDSKDLPLIY